MNSVDEHIAAILLEWVRVYGDGIRSSFTPKSAASSLKAQFGIDVSELQTGRILDELANNELAKKTHSPLTNGFFEINVKMLSERFAPPQVSLSLNPTDFVQPPTDASKDFPVINAYFEAGGEWANFVVGALQSGDFIDSGVEVVVPASDRVVSLNHNQQVEIEEPLDEVVSLVEAENSINGQESLRELTLGQLKAGRELVKVGVFSLRSLQLTLIVGLRLLAEKYADMAIGVLAGQLLDIFLKQYGIG